jgi:hypothetical protein
MMLDTSLISILDLILTILIILPMLIIYLLVEVAHPVLLIVYYGMFRLFITLSAASITVEQQYS